MNTIFKKCIKLIKKYPQLLQSKGLTGALAKVGLKQEVIVHALFWAKNPEIEKLFIKALQNHFSSDSSEVRLAWDFACKHQYNGLKNACIQWGQTSDNRVRLIQHWPEGRVPLALLPDKG